MHKKILAVLAVVSSLLLLQSRANDIEPTKEFYTAIHKGTPPMSIDGNLTEWTGVPVLSDPKFAIPKGAGPGGQPGDVANPNYVLWESLGGTWSGPDDQTSAVEVVWDADNVYLGFIVTDDYHENAANSAWNGDSVQLMVTKADRAGAQGVGFFLYNFALGGTDGALNDPATQTITELETPAPGAAAGTDVEAVVRRDTAAKKTYYEIRLSATALGLTPGSLAAGTKFGLGMAINDGDETEPGQKGWGGLGAHAIVFGKHPSETALVTLSSQTPGADIIFLSAVNPQLDKFTFRVNDKGTSISAPATAKLTVNGTVVTLTSTPKSGGAVDFTYTPATPFAPGSVNTYAIEVKDTNGGVASDSGTFTTAQYGLLKVSDKVTPDTTKRGFVFKIHQNGKFTDNTYSRTVSQLAGALGPNLADPAAQGPALAAATPNTAANTNKPITFEVATVINMNIDPGGDPQGNFTPDDQFPGTPGIDPGTGTTMLDGIAADVLTYVEMKKGMHTFIVNSDDGFRTFVGRVNDVFSGTFAGGFEGGRGATDSPFQVYAPEDGVYAMRTLFEQGAGGGNLEILELLADGVTKALINDDASGGPKSYRAATGADAGGTTDITSVTPGPGSTGVNGGGTMSVVITEGSTAVDLSSIQLKVDGQGVTVTPAKSGNTITTSYTPATPLAAGAFHTNTFTFTAGGVTRTETWTYKTSLLGPGTLFIEAEDWNFGHGQYITDQAIGMTGPYTGGAYQDKGDGLGGADCDGSDFGIDYHDNNTTSDQAIYRPNTPMEAGKLNGPAGFNRGTFNVEINHVVGWTGSDEWMNYTRDFPVGDNAYKVIARMARDGGTRGGTLSKLVGGDPAQCNTQQVFELLGSFSGPGTGGWDSWPDAGTPADAILMMKDASGADAIIKLSGKQTLRWQFALDSGDLDYIAFIPQPKIVLPPKLVTLTPGDGSSGQPVAPKFTAVIQDQDSTVTGTTLKLNGATVTPTVTKTGDKTTVTFTPSTAFAPGSTQKYTLTYTDSNGGTTTKDATFSITFHPLPAGTLFIEAEDWNFGHGQYITDQAIGMTGPYTGGAYQDKGDGLNGSDCDGTDFGIDYHDNNSGSDQAVYRPNTPMEAGKRNGPAGFARGAFDVQINHVVGWTGSDEWMNYTRDFPNSNVGYKVVARMARDGGNRGGILFKVTGDTAACSDTDQVTEELGRFSGPGTGGWDSWPDTGADSDAILTMKDASGADAIVKLSGKQTLRFQYDLDAGDIDYLAFIPQGVVVLPPKLVSISPADGGSGAKLKPAFSAVIQDQEATVTGVTLKLNGVAVTPTVTKTGNQSTVTFTPSAEVAPGSQNVYSLTFTDSSGGSTTKDVTFHATYTPLPAGTLFIEAEDWNFGHGQYDTVNAIGMTGPYAGGTYQGKGDGLNGAACDGSDFGIDYNDSNATSDQAVYRPGTPMEAGKRNGPEGLDRGTFDVQVNHVVGWTDATEWMNYTRDFPATPTAYKVYARMARDVGANRGGVLFSVAGDTTACASTSQTTTQLGTFSAAPTGGWDTWTDNGTSADALIPMKDANGAIATVTLSGKTTLRFQYADGAGDIDYLAFVPAGTPPPNFTKVQVNPNGSITVEWAGGGTLQTTPALVPNGTWTDVPGATSPFTFTPQAGVKMLFARIKR